MLVKVTLEHGGKGVDGRVINGQMGGAVYWSTLLWRVLIQKKYNLESFLNGNVIKKRKTEKSCPTNLSGKGEEMVADSSIVLFSATLWNPNASFFFFGMFLVTGGANS